MYEFNVLVLKSENTELTTEYSRNYIYESSFAILLLWLRQHQIWNTLIEVLWVC